MKIQLKTVMIFTIFFIVFFIIVNFFLNTYLSSRFNEIEQNEAIKDSERAKDAFYLELEGLDLSCRDWSKWDESYDFAIDKNEDYKKTNLHLGSFGTLGVDAVIYLDENYEVIYEKLFDYKNQKEKDIPVELKNKILTAVGKNERIKGLIIFDGEIILISANEIIPSSYIAPKKGELIMARYFDVDLTEKLAKTTQVNISLPEIIGYDLENPEESVKIERINNNLINGKIRINDPLKEHTVLIKTNIKREIKKAGQEAIKILDLLIFLACIASVIIVFLVFKMQILNRLNELVSEMRKIFLDRKYNKRLPILGKDELSEFAINVNGVIGEIENYKKELESKNKDLEKEKKKLEEKIGEMEKMQKVFVGRELRMIELKKKIDELGGEKK